MRYIKIVTKNGNKISGVLNDEPVKGYRYSYMLRHADDDWDEICTIEKNVFCNRYGRIHTKRPVKFECGPTGADGKRVFNYSEITDWSFE